MRLVSWNTQATRRAAHVTTHMVFESKALSIVIVQGSEGTKVPRFRHFIGVGKSNCLNRIDAPIPPMVLQCGAMLPPPQYPIIANFFFMTPTLEIEEKRKEGRRSTRWNPKNTCQRHLGQKAAVDVESKIDNLVIVLGRGSSWPSGLISKHPVVAFPPCSPNIVSWISFRSLPVPFSCAPIRCNHNAHVMRSL